MKYRPIERTIALNEITRLRVECGNCHTMFAFDLAWEYAGNAGDHCPFCNDKWERLEDTVRELVLAFKEARKLKNQKISLETEV